MMSFEALKAELIAAGVPEAAADAAAASRLAEMMTKASQDAQKERSDVMTGTNEHGLPCVMKRSKRKATLSPCCESKMAVLCPGGSSIKAGKKTEYGPRLVLHFAEYVTESGYVAPANVMASAGSSSSICKPEESAAWQFAGVVFADQSIRLFFQHEDGKEAEELIDRDAWLNMVNEEISLFYDDIRAVRSSGVASRRR